jgi:hypothetical protein
MSKILAAIFLLGGLSAAQAQLNTMGNDTGGMIVWTPENETLAPAAAAGHCAAYGKEARITSVYRQYGHYIGFACGFPAGYIVHEREYGLRTKG